MHGYDISRYLSTLVSEVLDVQWRFVKYIAGWLVYVRQFLVMVYLRMHFNISLRFDTLFNWRT